MRDGCSGRRDQDGHQFAKKSRRTPARGTCDSLMFFFCSSVCAGIAAAPHTGLGVRRPVSRVLCQPRERRGMAIPLGRPLPDASRDLPGRLARKPAFPPQRERRPYLVLLPVGFTVPSPSPATRCALTAPFHPHPQAGGPGGQTALCGTFPGVAPAGHYPAPCFRGARTFLPRVAPGAAIRPPDPI